MAGRWQSDECGAATLTIDLDALSRNYSIIARAAAPASVGGVVKANAYGLGAAPIARRLLRAGCRDLFVAHLGEAEALMAQLPRGDRPPGLGMYVLNGLVPGDEPACAALGAIPVLNAPDQIERWAAEADRIGRRLPCAIQIDTGMSRLGLAPADADRIAVAGPPFDRIRPVLVMSHLACGDDPADPANEAQRERFELFADRFPGARRSLANSGGAFMDGFAGDLVRTGIALYGGAPHAGRDNPMAPVVSLSARIIQVRTVEAGGQVGYGLDWTAARDSRIATVGVGYADGWPRALGNRGAAYLGGIRVPIVGRVSMDSLTLDVTDVPPALLDGAMPVELLGPHQGIDDVARDADTIAYEILTRLGSRYDRVYLDGDGIGAPHPDARHEEARA